MGQHVAAGALVVPEEPRVRWRHDDVMHHRGPGLGQDRLVQVCEQLGVAVKARRQDSEIVHWSSPSAVTLTNQRARSRDSRGRARAGVTEYRVERVWGRSRADVQGGHSRFCEGPSIHSG